MEENTEYKPFVSGQYDPEESGYYNTQSSLTVTKNDCSSGTTASSVTLTANANQFMSTTSQVDVDTQTQAWLNANAQAYANNVGICNIGTATPLQAFNYLVVRYKWTEESGEDLDTFTGVVNTGSELDNIWLGFGQTYAGGYPSNYSISNFYLISGGDNELSGVESCLINFGKITTDFPDLDIIQLRMAGNWYDSRVTGDIEIEIETYMDGTMSRAGFDFENSGSPVQHLSFSKNISAVGHLASNIEAVTNIGYITYNKNSLMGQITI